MRCALLAIMLCAAPAAGQSVSTGVSRDTILVGDPVRVVLRIDNVPAGSDIILPDTLAAIDDVENGGRLRLRRDTIGGALRVTAAYPLILWRPGPTALPPLPMVVRTGVTERTLQIELPVINVVSVLPLDTTNIKAKPPKDVWGADRIWWPWVLAALVVLAIAALGWWWYRRRKAAQGEITIAPFIDPRERAARELQRIRALQLIEKGELKQHYILVAETLRIFAGALESDWSTDLTTEELGLRIKRRPDAAPLLRLLRSADMVKFARREPTAAEARADLDAAEQWVQEYDRRADAEAA